jgi:hypothetical protein
MRMFPAVACSLLIGVALSATALSGPKNQSEFERIKSLEGNWVGKMSDGKSVHISYKVISSGSAVMESMDHDGMVTIYHLNGDTLMLTHYCSAGNQPRMHLVSSTPESLIFDMFDATNLDSVNDGHMSGLVLTFKDKNHLTADWSMSKDGKVAHHGIFVLTRAK